MNGQDYYKRAIISLNERYLFFALFRLLLCSVNSVTRKCICYLRPLSFTEISPYLEDFNLCNRSLQQKNRDNVYKYSSWYEIVIIQKWIWILYFQMHIALAFLLDGYYHSQTYIEFQISFVYVLRQNFSILKRNKNAKEN